jgi:hypothetical protein
VPRLSTRGHSLLTAHVRSSSCLSHDQSTPESLKKNHPLSRYGADNYIGYPMIPVQPNRLLHITMFSFTSCFFEVFRSHVWTHPVPIIVACIPWSPPQPIRFHEKSYWILSPMNFHKTQRKSHQIPTKPHLIGGRSSRPPNLTRVRHGQDPATRWRGRSYFKWTAPELEGFGGRWLQYNYSWEIVSIMIGNNREITYEQK